MGPPYDRPVELDRLEERLAAARVARLATTGEGGPHLVPITFVLEGGQLYSAVDDVKPKSGKRLRRLVNIAADPRVAVLVDHYEDDWSGLWWIRLDGLARVIPAGGERESALRALAAKYPQYRDTPPTGPVIAVRPLRWSSWRGSEGAGG